jgi:hypothetical protein
MATDDCTGPVTPVARRADGKPLTDPFPISPPGSMGNLVIWTATDAFGNQDVESQAVYVIKTHPPTVTLNGSSSMSVNCHGSFIDPGATATDSCAGSLPVNTSGSVDPNTPGTYSLTYSATNPYYGSVGTATRTVTVVDTTPPVVTAPANITRPTDPGQCSAQVNVGTATATDACAGPLTPAGARSDGKPLTDPYPVGMTTITWKASDLAGNQASTMQTVIVADQ